MRFLAIAGLLGGMAAFAPAAHAVSAASTGSVTVNVSQYNGGWLWDYTISTGENNVANLMGLTLPEVNAGDLTALPAEVPSVTNGTPTYYNPWGWSFDEVSTPKTAAALKSGTAGAFIVITAWNNDYNLAPDSSIDFYFTSAYGTSTDATFALSFDNESVTLIDPPVPNSNAVPEPASLVLLGSGLVMGAWRRRRSAA